MNNVKEVTKGSLGLVAQDDSEARDVVRMLELQRVGVQLSATRGEVMTRLSPKAHSQLARHPGLDPGPIHPSLRAVELDARYCDGSCVGPMDPGSRPG
jgi:hypothetical protein